MTQAHINDVSTVIWWLDTAALPDLIWAKSWIGLDGHVVQTCDGALHLFENQELADQFLREDEYDTIQQLRADGEVPQLLTPPDNQ